MDPLIEMSVDKWPELKDMLRHTWPLNVPGYYALYLNLKYVKVRDAFQFKVYCPYGDIKNGFIATSLKDGLECIIWPISKDTRKLEDALRETRVIDWSQKVCIDTVSSVVLQMMERIRPQMRFSYYHVGLAKLYFLDKSTKPFRDLSCPPNTYLAAVKEDLIERVDNSWPYRHSESVWYFSTLAQNGLSYALYSASDDTILAWIFLNEYFFLCHLYCEERYRRHGFAKYLMKYVINEQLGLGNDLYGYVVDGNEKSAGLFLKLGFKVVDDAAYLFVQK